MQLENGYPNHANHEAVSAILKAIDSDVERGEDVLMFGFCAVLLSSTAAPIAPPIVLLPIVAIVFACSASWARFNYHKMAQKLSVAMQELKPRERALLQPLADLFIKNPMESLTDSFNPFKNLKRIYKSILGGILINPLWIPIFYTMGIQMTEEKNLIELNRAIIGIEQQIAPYLKLQEQQPDIPN